MPSPIFTKQLVYQPCVNRPAPTADIEPAIAGRFTIDIPSSSPTPKQVFMLINFSGSGFSRTAGKYIGVDLNFNGVKVLEITTFASDAANHKAFVPTAFLYTYGDGVHPIDLTVNFAIDRHAGTILDDGDFFNLTVAVLLP
ncbi:MAG TPA: hypothetical protein VG367_09495 [Mucilaginibacter sp.]|nr:hypothetical protein [Mucilaginibacter sp.]